jgi:hypothetical protein
VSVVIHLDWITWVRNISLGLGVATVIAFTMVVPRIGTISTWKIVLGAIGIAMFVLAGRDGTKAR